MLMLVPAHTHIAPSQCTAYMAICVAYVGTRLCGLALCHTTYPRRLHSATTGEWHDGHDIRHTMDVANIRRTMYNA